ncbi:MAG: uracil-DNA glycosylase family protein [Muribaculaceae bacterium]|nr:uracil-DNA glycosylase family protein [Muribaculaceae bacterium]
MKENNHLQTPDLESAPVEIHPFEPFIPENAKILIMGTFPPQPKRWAMDFYYPNRSNDFWPMMGLIFLGDRDALYDRQSRHFRLDLIKALLNERGIALNDTGHRIRRLMNNASDKYLEILEPVDLDGLLAAMPGCHTVATTGEKAADVLADITGTEAPKMGAMVRDAKRGLDLWRMPSTSRAYPLALEKKAAYYETMFRSAGLL